MPSQKQNSSSDNNLLHHHNSSQQQPSRCKRSRSQRGGAENDDDNEDERDYEQDEEEEQQQQVKEEEQDSEDDDSDGSRSSDDPANLPERLHVELPALRTYVQCPICLGIIKKTRTVTECLHRFCGECIDKWMRMGNKECPTCRTHCASQRSLRDDPQFDALIHFLYDDIEKYEEEELAFHEEEKTRNKQASTSMKHGHLSGGHVPVSDTLERLGRVGTRAV